MSRRPRKSKPSDLPVAAYNSKAELKQSATSGFTPNWWAFLALAVVAGGVAFFLFDDQSQLSKEKPSPPVPVAQKIDVSPALARNTEPLATLATNSVRVEQAVIENQLDPNQDGWETEVAAEQVKVVLTQLAGRLTGQDIEEIFASQVAEKVAIGQLRPQNLSEVFRNGEPDRDAVIVSRPESKAEQTLAGEGHDALRYALDELAKPFAEMSDVHVHIKVVRVTETEGVIETESYFEADGQSQTGSLQQRATWICKWQRLPLGNLELISLQATNYEEVAKSGTWFTDCTKAVLEKNDSFREQLSFGLNHWLSRLERQNGIHVFARSGLAVGDVNGDGLDDVYVCQPGGLPNRLFIQDLDGTASDLSREAGVDWLDHTSSSLFLDLDNDGDQDLVAATAAGLLVMENDGTGKFRLRATLASRDTDTQSFSAADFDNDGDLDLYICIEFSNKSSLGQDPEVSFVYHDANDGAANVLYRNDVDPQGKWKFTDVTKEVGLDVDNRRHSLACAWEDYDNDGDQDLYVANDYGQNCLYRNDNGKFENVALDANAVDSASGMSVSWADYNRDGWMDLYVANMFSSAGSRITRQEQFKSGAEEEFRNIYSRFAKGNTLLENDGQGEFREVSSTTGVEMGRWAWSSVFGDINNDAWDDLLVANGYITTEDTGDL